MRPRKAPSSPVQVANPEPYPVQVAFTEPYPATRPREAPSAPVQVAFPEPYPVQVANPEPYPARKAQNGLLGDVCLNRHEEDGGHHENQACPVGP